MKKANIWVKPEVRKAFEEMMFKTIASCQPHHKDQIPTPTLVFKNIGGTAGRNTYNPIRKNSVVIINPAYFKKEGGYDEQLNKTLPHEVAHHVCDFIWGLGKHNKSHGWQWARVMSWIGLPAERCHRMDTDGIVNRHERPYSYTCACSTPHLLTARLHLRIQRAGRTRICKRCKNRIVFLGIQSKGGLIELRDMKPVNKPSIGQGSTVVKFVPITPQTPIVALTPTVPKPPEPKPTHKTVTRFINGMLQNVRVPIEA